MTTTDARKRLAENNTVTVTVPPNDRAKRREAYEKALRHVRVLAQVISDGAVQGDLPTESLIQRYRDANRVMWAAMDALRAANDEAVSS